MRANLMAGFRNFLNETRKSLGHPTQDKERSLSSVFSEEFKDAFDVSFDSRGIGIPLLIPNLRRERFHLEVILDIDRENVQHLIRIPVWAVIDRPYNYDPLRTRTVFAVSTRITTSRSQDIFLI